MDGGPVTNTLICLVDLVTLHTYGPEQFKWARSSGVEHLTFNQRVDGSIPSGLTSQFAVD